MYKFVSRPLLCRQFSGKVKKLSSKLSNTQRPPKDPPDEGYEPTCIDHDGIQVSEFVRPSAFRQFSGPDEKLGPGAGKGLEYKNAQYFGYHRFSFVELQSHAVEMRDDRRLSGGIQDAIEADEEEECNDASVKTMKEMESECDKIIAVQAKQLEEAEQKAKQLEAKKQQELCEAQEKKKQEEMEWCKKKAEETKAVKINTLLEMTDEQLKEWCDKSLKAQLEEKNKSEEEDKCDAEQNNKEAEKCEEECKKKEDELKMICEAEQKKKEEELKMKCESEENKKEEELRMKCEAEQKKKEEEEMKMKCEAEQKKKKEELKMKCEQKKKEAEEETKCGMGNDKKPTSGADGDGSNNKK
ncbi:axoneme-associated protein mst101(2) isoform X1 [Drosophila obscura]|uniref:axoneme-associated protein mst101(2) isoform X1 n=1 Tax=Drosophila obscura TaxID=7282 RepID=UPI001BB1C049|nr:axoneme-associated protein mst101(2) isoform X1 [Drosophila obscura]